MEDSQNQQNFDEKLTEIEQLDINNFENDSTEIEINKAESKVVEEKENDAKNEENQQKNAQNLMKIDDFAKKQIILMNFRQAGTVFSNLSFFVVIGSIFILLGGVFSILFGAIIGICLFALLVFLAVVTVGVIIASDHYKNGWKLLGDFFGNFEKITEFVNKAYSVVPYIAIVGAIASILAIVFLSISKNHKSILRIVLSSISLAIILFVLIFSWSVAK